MVGVVDRGSGRHRVSDEYCDIGSHPRNWAGGRPCHLYQPNRYSLPAVPAVRPIGAGESGSHSNRARPRFAR